jgi:hypothetical protein
MRRRKFIKATIATAALAVPGAVWLALRPKCSGDAVDLGIQKVFIDDCQIQRLGMAYREVHPGEDDPAILQKLVASADVGFDLDDTIRQEFSSGNTVLVDGWVLSRTEARRYALHSLHGN